MQARRMIVGAGLIGLLFVIFAGIGIYEAGLHHGTGPTAHTFEVSVQRDGMTPSTLPVREGDQVILSIASDRDQTLSIPGYGLTFTLTPAAPVAATFVATRAGSFDIVLDRTGAKVGVLKVS
jgi:hypothetical protein